MGKYSGGLNNDLDGYKVYMNSHQYNTCTMCFRSFMGFRCDYCGTICSSYHIVDLCQVKNKRSKILNLIK